jgi:hypothetical protein
VGWYAISLDQQVAEERGQREEEEEEEEDAETATLRFRADLVLSPRQAVTAFHVDSGFATWFDMVEGE